MFKSLKRKFLVIYFFSILIIISFSFGFVYYNSYINTKTTIQRQLASKDEISKLSNKRGPDGISIDTTLAIESPDNELSLSYTIEGDHFIEPEFNEIFNNDIYVEFSEDNEVISTYSSSQIDSQTLEEILDLVNTSGDNNMISYNDCIYMYSSFGNYLKLVDVTSSINLLNQLKNNLLVIGLMVIFISVLIATTFFDKIIKPIEKNYNQQVNFVSDASHEIKTPISIISSCLNMIQDDDDEKDKWLDYCINETQRLKNLTTRLLSLSNSEKDINLKELESIDIAKELELIVSAFEVNLFENNFKLDYDISEATYAKIYIDDFKQLMHIFLDNAIKYNNDQKQINVSLSQTTKQAKLIISNTTEEITDEQLKLLFERFYRVDQSRNKKTEGFGLGLSLANLIMKRYNIKNNVSYKDGQIFFELLLPFK